MADHPFVALTHSSTLRRLLYEALAALGLDPTDTYRQAYQGVVLAPQLTTGSIDMLRQFARNCLGVTLLPVFPVAADIA